MIAEAPYLWGIPILVLITIAVFVIDLRALMKLILISIICFGPIALSIGVADIRIWMVLTVIYLIRYLFLKQRFDFYRAGPYVISLVIVVLTATISRLVNEIKLALVLRELIFFCLTLFLFMAIINLGKNHFRELAHVIVRALSVSAVVGILQAILAGHPNFLDLLPKSLLTIDYVETVRAGRALGLSLNNTHLALQLLTIFPLIFILKRQKWILYAIFALGIIVTLTRSAIALFFLSSAMIFTKLYRAKRAVGIAYVIIIVGLGLWFGWLKSFEKADRLLNIMDANTRYKLQAQLIALRVTKERALFFGFGEQQFEALSTYQTQPMFSQKALKHIGLHNPHNIFISSFLQYGFLVVLAGMVSIFILFKTILRFSAETGEKTVYFLFALVILLPILNALIHSWDISQFTGWNAVVYSLPFAYYSWRQKGHSDRQ